ncbi:stress protein A family protein [Rhizoctonia solani]|uniref:Stress protein A family protein n=1 Tax=Rhizoctonia solani TaxID=456999 RepID=A0A8H8P8A3_9AGAM|nr:stress protein A family protein [Rhizoctonia solani]QRW27115.1 stress protein A family protein [Rhizoctonia solani]
MGDNNYSSSSQTVEAPDATMVIAPTPKSARRTSWFGWPKKGLSGPQRPNSALTSGTPSTATTSTSTSTTSSPAEERNSPFDNSPVTPPEVILQPSSSGGLDLSMSRTHSLPSVNNMSMLTPVSPSSRTAASPSPLTRQLSLTELDKKAEQLILTAIARSTSRDGATGSYSVSSSPTQPTRGADSSLSPPPSAGGSSSGFSKKASFSSYLGLGALSLTREKTPKPGDNERGRKDREDRGREARARSSSPFRRFSFASNASEDGNGSRRGRSRVLAHFVTPKAISTKVRKGKKRAKKAAGLGDDSAQDQTEENPDDKDKEDVKVPGEPDDVSPTDPSTSPSTTTKEGSVPASSTAGDDDTDSDSDESSGSWDSDEESWSSGDIQFDDQTQLNTALNSEALQSPELMLAQQEEAAEFDSDPLGEGVNIVQPTEPVFEKTYFSRPGTTNSTSGSTAVGKGNGQGDQSSAGPTDAMGRGRKKSMRHDALELTTSRPVYGPNRCMIMLTHGNPDAAEREGRRYVVASDLSEESRYAVEWGIGTVLRDGDEMIVVNVQETESKLDEATNDKSQKIKNQQERHTLTYLLCRQVTGLLQRTRLNVRVFCQAIHSKNSRRMLLDLIDYTEPTMAIVGSRGLNALKGILLGSTSHYLIQKSSVPVMVARRRLKRPARRAAHLETHKRVPISEAAIDKAGPGKAERDADATRDQIESEEAEDKS